MQVGVVQVQAPIPRMQVQVVRVQVPIPRMQVRVVRVQALIPRVQARVVRVQALTPSVPVRVAQSEVPVASTECVLYGLRWLFHRRMRSFTKPRGIVSRGPGPRFPLGSVRQSQYFV